MVVLCAELDVVAVILFFSTRRKKVFLFWKMGEPCELDGDPNYYYYCYYYWMMMMMLVMIEMRTGFY
jgi:hypothetical protein